MKGGKQTWVEYASIKSKLGEFPVDSSEKVVVNIL